MWGSVGSSPPHANGVLKVTTLAAGGSVVANVQVAVRAGSELPRQHCPAGRTVARPWYRNRGG